MRKSALACLSWSCLGVFLWCAPARGAGPSEGGDDAWFVLSPAVSDGAITLSIDFKPDIGGIQGWALSLCHDGRAVRLASYGASDALSTIRNGYLPDFYTCEEATDGPRSGIVQAAVLAFTEPLVLPATEGGFPVLEARYDVLEESSVGICSGLQGLGQPVTTALTIRGVTYVPSEFPSAALVQKPYAGKLTYRVEPPQSSEVVTVKLYSEEIAVEGWSFALCHTAQSADLVEMATSPELEQLVGGEPPEFILNDTAPADPFVAVRQAVVLGTSLGRVAMGPFPEGLAILGLRYSVHRDDSLKFCDDVGGVRFDNHVMVEGIGYVPGTRDGATLVTAALGTRFIRGDANLDGRMNMTDAVHILMSLFLGAGPLPCLDAADSNDVGRVDISDPIFILRYLFIGGPQPPSPFPDAGEDLSPETALGCERGM